MEIIWKDPPPQKGRVARKEITALVGEAKADPGVWKSAEFERRQNVGRLKRRHGITFTCLMSQDGTFTLHAKAPEVTNP